MKTSIILQLVFITFGFFLCTLPNIEAQDEDAFDASNDDGIAIAGDVSDDATGQWARISYRNFDSHELTNDEDEDVGEDEPAIDTEIDEDEEPRLDIRSWGNDVPNYARKLKKSQLYECEKNDCISWCQVFLKLPEGRCSGSGKCYCATL